MRSAGAILPSAAVACAGSVNFAVPPSADNRSIASAEYPMPANRPASERTQSLRPLFSWITSTPPLAFGASAHAACSSPAGPAHVIGAVSTVFSLPALWTRTLRLLLVPWPLNVTPAFAPVASPASIRFAAGLGWLAACGWGAWRARRGAPAVALGLVWMAIFFLPVANLWPLLHPVADRYFYPVAPGFAILAAWVLAHQSRAGRTLGLAALAAIYALLLAVRLGQWESAGKLWTAAYFQNPHSAAAATWLGLLREEAGDAAGAREFYKAAVEANPQADLAWGNWGILEGRMDRRAESERLLRRVVELRPKGAKGWYDLSVCLERQGRQAEAAEAAARAAALW